MDNGVIPLLVPLLAHSKAMVSETDCHIQMGHLTPLFPSSLLPYLCAKFSALRILGNIATGTEAQTQAILDSGILPHLHKLMEHSHPSIAQVSHVRASGIVGSKKDCKWFNVHIRHV